MIDPRLSHAVAVAREGSFTAAARSVGVTQSAITKSIADLETRLGHLIFHRTSRGTLLTEEGREFVERASRLLEDATDLLQGAREKDDPYAGVLSVGICPASMEWCLIEPLSRLLNQHPSIRLDVSGSTFERVVQQLRNGRIDVAVGFAAAFHEWPDLTSTPISYLRANFFVRKGHPLLAKAQVTQEDMAGYEFVSPSDSRPYGAAIRDIFESQGIDWRKRLHVIDFFPIVRSVVAKTDAIGVVDVGYANSVPFRREFETIEAFDPIPRDPLCCATRVRWEPKPSVKAFVAAMKACLPFEEGAHKGESV